MKYILHILIVFFFLGVLTSEAQTACECPVTVLTKKECSKYEIIFRGKVLSVAPCKNKPGVAVFEVQDLYKGSLTKNFKVLFSCEDPCARPFQEDEEWIIYTRYKQIDNAMIDWCSRSRKFIKLQAEDYYLVTHGISYDDEIKFLQDSLGLHRLMKEQANASQHRNLLPTTNQSILILVVSILFILAFYYLFNKFFK
jgi:hypothetical protein